MNNLDVIKKQVNCKRSWDWPQLAEETNDNNESEIFPDILLRRLFEEADDKKIYINDSELSIKFFDTLTLPENKKIKLTNTPGCLVCHSTLIPDNVHYSMITGLCDIKTVQYYLFSKGILWRSWYIKQHLKHINIKQLSVKEIKPISDIEIINEQILDLRRRINELESLDESGNKNELNNLRRQLKDFLEMKLKISDSFEEESSDKEIKFDDIIAAMKKNQ